MKKLLIALTLVSVGTASPIPPAKRSGEVFELDVTPKNLLYNYTEETKIDGAREIIQTRFSQPDGKVAVEENVVFENGLLKRYEIDQKQEGFLNVLEVNGDSANYRRTNTQTGEVDNESDDWGPNYTAAPGLLGFARRNWDALMAGNRVDFRLAVPEKQTTYGFEITKASEHREGDREIVVLTAQPSSWFVSLFFNGSFKLTIDKTEKRLVRLQGPSLPKVAKGPNEMRDLEADTVYFEAGNSL